MPEITLRSINELLTGEDGQPARYFIPAYQRGYRWNTQQVTDLLDDIWEFIINVAQRPKGAFYCLQPLVVKKQGDGSYEVVDGQQRLTTIYILLQYASPILEMINKAPYSIEYALHDANFLQNIDLERANENIDFYHMAQALQAILNWFESRDGNHKLAFLQHLLNDDETGCNVKVIWYELPEEEDAVSAFTRLNVGKIPLTPDELIRALLMRKADLEDQTHRLTLQIASEWGQIEKKLQDDAFWYFLQNDDPGFGSRIGLIFKLIAMREDAVLSEENFSSFAYYAELFKQDVSIRDAWDDIKQTFMRLEEWYEDRTLFHIIGFKLNQADPNMQELHNLLGISGNTLKSDFVVELKQDIFKAIFQPDEDKHGQYAIDETCKNVRYGQSRQPQDILLLFNLASLLQNNQSNIRFQFDRFKQEKWDVEHIRSQSEERPSNDRQKQHWLEECQDILSTLSDEAALKLNAQISTYLEKEPEALTFEELDEQILQYFKEGAQQPEQGLGNLTLLDRSTNRSYKNALFGVKRGTLLARDQAGIFVPLCTRNVFLKCYSPNVGNPVMWREDDAQDYLKAIIDTLTQFFDTSSGEA